MRQKVEAGAARGGVWGGSCQEGWEVKRRKAPSAPCQQVAVLEWGRGLKQPEGVRRFRVMPRCKLPAQPVHAA